MVSVGQPERWLKDSIRLVQALEGSKEREASYRQLTPGVEPIPAKPKVNPVNLKRVEVPSNTHQDVVYTMVCHRRTGEVLSCSCNGFRFRRTCTHKLTYEDANKKGAK